MYKKIDIILSNGVKRKAQQFPSGKIVWVNKVDNKLKRYVGSIINDVFQTDVDISGFKMIRDRTNPPQSKEEFLLRAKKHRDKIKLLSKTKMGDTVIFNDVERKINYTSFGKGFIIYKGKRYSGENVNGFFVKR
jgi:hypothetical protein